MPRFCVALGGFLFCAFIAISPLTNNYEKELRVQTQILLTDLHFFLKSFSKNIKF
jgi:hypothetical protein